MLWSKDGLDKEAPQCPPHLKEDAPWGSRLHLGGGCPSCRGWQLGPDGPEQKHLDYADKATLSCPSSLPTSPQSPETAKPSKK